MNEKLEAIKNIYLTLVGIGWNPFPFLIAAAALILGRRILEPDVLDINSVSDKRKAGIIKLAIIAATFLVTLITQIAVSRADDWYDGLLCVGLTILNVAVGYFIYSVYAAVAPVELAVKLIRRMTGQQETPK